MEKLLLDAGELIEGLRYVDDLELVSEDIVGCSANASDLPSRLIVISSPGA